MKQKNHGQGFTLVEVLVVIGIIGVLVAMLIPAIQAAREAARRVQCQNHLKQLGLAAINHQEQVGYFPSSGWGWGWVGDPDRGFGAKQPGNWTYNLLPFLEEQSLYDLPADGLPNQLTERQLAGAKRLVEHSLSILYCPSRRAAIAYPHVPLIFTHINASLADVCGQLDYGINYGDTLGQQRETGPESLRAVTNYPWYFTKTGDPTKALYDRWSDYRPPWFTSPITGEVGLNGVGFVRSEVAVNHIVDGTSNTYLIGEYGMDPAVYEYNEGATAWCTALHGRLSGFDAPVHDSDADNINPAFGSAHPAAFHVAFCDGSVRAIEYGVDLAVHRTSANRKDGTAHGTGVSNDEWPIPHDSPR